MANLSEIKSRPVTMWPTIASFTPTTGGNVGNVTCIIKGGSLEGCTNVTLSGSGSNTNISASSVVYNSDRSLSAVFNLSGQSTGSYTLNVTNPEISGYQATGPAPFIITNGGYW